MKLSNKHQGRNQYVCGLINRMMFHNKMWKGGGGQEFVNEDSLKSCGVDSNGVPYNGRDLSSFKYLDDSYCWELK